MNLLPKTKTSEILVQDLEKELLVYDLQTNKAFCLNETCGLVFQLCDGTKTIADISSSIARKLNQPINDELIWLALDGLKKENLLENSEHFEIDFNGLNRRQIIRKVGFASMIALPIVSSVIAPSAAMAQSGALPLLAACSTNPDCASGICNTCLGGCAGFGPKYCCAGTGAHPPGFREDGCSPSGTCSSFVSLCCTGQLVEGPATCGLGGRVSCFCA